MSPSSIAVATCPRSSSASISPTELSIVRPVAAKAPSGKSLELWYIERVKSPKSMGVVSGGNDPIKMPLPAGISLEKATFAVTVEPKGGSPTGDPTGPVIYSGQL